MGIFDNGCVIRNHLDVMSFWSTIKKIHAIFFHMHMNQVRGKGLIEYK